jgi:hypothetical protein
MHNPILINVVHNEGKESNPILTPNITYITFITIIYVSKGLQKRQIYSLYLLEMEGNIRSPCKFFILFVVTLPTDALSPNVASKAKLWCGD